MKRILQRTTLGEAVDLSVYSPRAKVLSKDLADRMIASDSPVIAWHGTSYYWAMFLCLYGIQGNVPAPTMTLGQGNNQTGYVRTSDAGLYVSNKPIRSQINFVKIEVKPSELGVPREMSPMGYTSGLESLAAGEAIITKMLPARRITLVNTNGKVYSREKFLALEMDPKEFIYSNRDNNFYQNGDLTMLGKLEKNNLYTFLKGMLVNGTSPESIIISIDQMISYKDYELRGLTLKDMTEIRVWRVSKIK